MSSLLDPEKRSWGEIAYRAKSAFAVLLSLAVLIGGSVFVYVKANEAWQEYRHADDYPGPGQDDVIVTIPRGATAYRISDILVANDVVKSAKVFDVAIAKNPKSSTIQAGRYRLKTKMPAEAALQMMLDPTNIIRTKVTIPEGIRLSMILDKLALPEADGGTGVARAEYQAVIDTQVAELGLPDYAQGNPEGFLFPDTYSFATDGTALAVLQQMVAQFQSVATETQLAARAKNSGVGAGQIVTIASIIENEVRRDEDRAKVARVIYNRLDQGMPLQMDSTVHYAVGKDGKVTTTDEDRKSTSPYNTYVRYGLPPGPIGSPGKASLNGALNPAQGEFLYFVTVDLDTGETLFASTLAEHNANVEKFQAWCQAHAGRC